MIQQSRILTRILTYIGLWPVATDEPYMRYVRLLICHLPTTFLVTTLMWMDAVLTTDISHTTDVLYMTLTESLLVIKMLVIWHNSPLAVTVLHDWQTAEIFKLRTPQERNMWQRAQKSFGYVASIYMGSCVFNSVSVFFSVFLTKELPISFWMPYNVHKPLNFWLTFVYQFWTIPLTALTNVSLDMLNCYMFFHVSLLYRLVGMRLQEFACDKNSSEQEIKQQLINHIQLHQSVNKYNK